MKISKFIAILITISLLLLAVSCTTTPPGTTPTTPTSPTTSPTTAEPTATEGYGILEIRASDPPPADNVTSAIVHLTNIEVHRVTNNGTDNVGEWIPIIGAPPSFDLMVVAQVTAILGSANVTAGNFTQIRMDVSQVDIKLSNGDNFTAEVPSGKLKIVRPFNVSPGGKTILTLDFDGQKSVNITGAGQALFKPVLKLLINDETSDEAPEVETIIE